jgi:hypothetical protein
MNYRFPIYWHIANPPTPNTFYSIAHEPFNPDEHVPAFVITLPRSIYSSSSDERNFQGGTIMALLQMIHEFYQGPATAEDINGIVNNLSSQSSRRERFIRLLERQEAGEIIRRIDVLGRGSTCEEIRDSKLLVD